MATIIEPSRTNSKWKTNERPRVSFVFQNFFDVSNYKDVYVEENSRAVTIRCLYITRVCTVAVE